MSGRGAATSGRPRPSPSVVTRACTGGTLNRLTSEPTSTSYAAGAETRCVVTTTEPTRVAVVTGGGSGLGRAFVRELVDAGFLVAALGRRAGALEGSIAGLTEGRAVAIVADVTDETSVHQAVRQVTDRWGRIDVLVNNAGIFGPAGEIDDVSLADIRKTLEVNVLGAVICARAVFPVMRSQKPGGGRIINNGSISAQVPRPQSAAYAMSKHALTGLTYRQRRNGDDRLHRRRTSGRRDVSSRADLLGRRGRASRTSHGDPAT